MLIPPIGHERPRFRHGWRAAIIAAFLTSSSAFAGPPYRTDDPEPVDYQHFEFFTYSAGTRVKGAIGGDTPAVEFDYGIVPNGRVAIIAPMSFSHITGEQLDWGYGDTDVEFKYRFIEQDKNGWRPSIGTVPSVKIPSGDFHRDLGHGVARVFLPIWLQKDFGDWTTYGGGGYWINHGRGNRNFWYVGWVVQRKIADKLSIGAEVFHQTADSWDKKTETGFNLGAIYDFSENYHLLFSVGRGIQRVRQTNELSWYVALLVNDTVEKPPEKTKSASGANVVVGDPPELTTSIELAEDKTEAKSKSKTAGLSASSTKGGGAAKASRADMKTPPQEAPKAAPEFPWTGFHVGAGVGYAAQQANEADVVCQMGPFSSSYSLKGVIGGPYIGFSVEMSSLLLGIETDVEVTGVTGGENISLVGLRQRHDVRASARGRAGLVIGRALPYVTGGAAIANFFPSALGESFHRANVGWTVGAGIEYPIADNWSAKLEYRHSDFGAPTYVSSNFDGNFYHVHVKDDSVRVGLAYHFAFAEAERSSQAAEAETAGEGAERAEAITKRKEKKKIPPTESRP